ncbi:ATP-dependent RNA helicase HrpA [Alloalcanivorax mobilis]|uniref:ATP-dependent RNA helicase HrpA n=1 Tax=Alloalcanivorax mobilis TaxID=2019569 RepID=UPI000B5B39F5|nr:ATP-dependent RNA helicase HrpA [Alloalcanivorax mobilis]ASK34056.1 ATP-dependent RNA helicase HrpA [Alcanivorax sp. N3-2A]|tara:strand:+ start:2060 stop:5911 length:3852 start_codon:yes stop_codon:yes gene_type:complete
MTDTPLNQLYQRLEQVRGADRPRLKKRLDGLRGRDGDAARAKLAAAIERSVAERERRSALIPARLDWPDLPVVHHREELAEAIRRHQVVVVAGETGSGKTTQLPKICLQLGRGANGYIGHTQPRRLAARSVASRLAEELHSQVGALVGYKVRFSEQVGDNSLIKLMTDGMLLSEVQNDRFLNRYDTLIIDEAHERSLNIDFLLGYLKQLLPSRPDLKVIITSATIDHRRFAEHFSGAPVFEVSGRTFAVETRYRPPEGERELGQQVEEVLREIQAEERRSGASGARDVLVFLSGERDIRDVHHHLKRCEFRDTELLPLYARLSAAEQQRVFSAHRGRRVVLSTNVAETSLTVPGIRYVIDAGTARISRYSVHSKVQRLPVEPVSQASANQRAGRSGRLMPGIAYRLYGEDDFLKRPAFTDPEIQRTNLAAVILQMADLRLGKVEDFPFMEPPDGRFVRDGYRLLEELGALDAQRQPTTLGRQLARFPLDPTLARMVVAGAAKQCLRETLVIVAGLAVQDPRERPRDKQQQADQAHQPFESKESDFLFFWNLWCWAEEQREALTRNQYEKLLKKNFLAPSRMREWRDTHRQLVLLAREAGWALNAEPAGYEPIHRALLTGLLGNVMSRDEEGEWLSTRNRKPLIWPGSALRKTKSRWLVAAEQVETSRLFARVVARVEPQWIEAEAAHLIKRQYSEPHWSKRRGCVMAKEQINLFGLVLAAGRRVNYGPLDPPLARELMIREGLVAGQLSQEPEFVKANRERLESLEEIEHKLRRRDILVDEEARVAFYDERLPEDLYSLAHLRTWYRKRADPAQRAALLMDDDFLLSRSAELREDAFPDHLRFGALELPLEYSFDPTGEQDGVTLVVPVAALAQVEQERLAWLVPGLLREKLEALIRALPKARRRHFVPVPDYVNALMEALRPDRPLLAALTRELQRMTGVRVEQEEWPEAQLAEHLRINVRVVDEHGATLAEGRDLAALRERFSALAVAPRSGEQPPPQEEREWRFGSLPVSDESEQGGLRLRYYPALEDRGDRVALVRVSDAEQAQQTHGYGVARLMLLRLPEQARQLRRFAGQQPGFQKLKAEKSPMARQALEQALLRATSEHFHLHQEGIRDEHSFQQRLDAGRGDFVPAAETSLAGWAAMFADYRGVMARLEKNFPLAWAHAHRDIKTQLAALFDEDFLLTTPAAWLREYPRYLAALTQRLEKLPGQIGRDRTVSAELEEYWQQYLRRAGDAPPWRQSEPLTLFRWMLEEYRVSLFAQTLGTRMPVSAKRLNRQWEAC